MQSEMTKKVDWLESGKYVVAVSGGVDSVVLLDLLATDSRHETTAPSGAGQAGDGRQETGDGRRKAEDREKNTSLESPTPNLQLIVAHFEHGIREDAPADARFVEALAQHYGIRFVGCSSTNLGSDASEEEARDARYGFLRAVKESCEADAIITAHHQDDVVETAIHNLLRGTYRKGVTSLRSTEEIKRPMLSVSKAEIYEYAKEKRLEWVEDATNRSLRYQRNYIRLRVIPAAMAEDAEFLKKFKSHIEKIRKLNEEIDQLEAEAFPRFIKKTEKGIRLKRSEIIRLDSLVSKELIVYTLKQYTDAALSEERVENGWLFVKTAQPGAVFQFDKHTEFTCTEKYCTISRK